jgi:hypothetical protein
VTPIRVHRHNFETDDGADETDWGDMIDDWLWSVLLQITRKNFVCPSQAIPCGF